VCLNFSLNRSRPRWLMTTRCTAHRKTECSANHRTPTQPQTSDRSPSALDRTCYLDRPGNALHTERDRDHRSGCGRHRRAGDGAEARLCLPSTRPTAVLDGMDAWNKGHKVKRAGRPRAHRVTSDPRPLPRRPSFANVCAQGQKPHVRQQHLPGQAFSWRAACRRWKLSSTIATSTSARSC
jgi:hypothetical protein